MKQHLILLLSLLLVVVNSASIEQHNVVEFDNIEESRINGENGWYVPKKNGGFEWIDMAAYASLQETEAKLEGKIQMKGRLFSNDVEFHLFTRSNPKEPQMITTNEESIKNSNFNPDKPTRFVIHGWMQDDGNDMNKDITSAWLEREDCNMIVVCWERAKGEYIYVVQGLPKVGKNIAQLIDYLHETYKLNLETLELIGHSLGAHVAGYTAKSMTSGQIYKIVGLDPAMPLISVKNKDGRLSDDDASYVEIIHTNGGKLGLINPIGNADFYVNGGKVQPGCGIDLFGKCSHQRSCTYYAESVKNNNYPAVSCTNYKDAVKKRCGSTYSSTKMNSRTNHLSANGAFYVPVNKKAPFGLGEAAL